MQALVFEQFGGPEVLHVRELPDPVPAANEVLVRTRAIGLNFADIYRRQGHYHLDGDPPWIAGYEPVGEVVSAPASSAFAAGDRVAFADSPFANAELVAVPADRLIPLPDDIEFDTAAALLLQGLTAQYLLRDSHPIRCGETVLVRRPQAASANCWCNLQSQRAHACWHWLRPLQRLRSPPRPVRT